MFATDSHLFQATVYKHSFLRVISLGAWIGQAGRSSPDEEVSREMLHAPALQPSPVSLLRWCVQQINEEFEIIQGKCWYEVDQKNDSLDYSHFCWQRRSQLKGMSGKKWQTRQSSVVSNVPKQMELHDRFNVHHPEALMSEWGDWNLTAVGLQKPCGACR